MPKEISHILIAKEVLAGLKRSEAPQMAPLIERNLSSFYLGAVIPDAFFYDMTPLLRISRNHLWISRCLHMKDAAENDRKAVGFFDGISAFSPPWEAQAAFAAGIVTHTVGDRIVHGVIDYLTKSWGETKGLAVATHRQIETLIDMVLLEPLGLHPRAFQLERRIDLDRSTRDTLFRFYLSRVAGASGAQDSCLVRALKRAHGQQILLLKLFSVRRLCQIMVASNRIVAPRLEPWSSLFYPEKAGTKGFPILNRLDLNTLTDGRSFSGSLPFLMKRIATEAILHICEGVQRLGQGKGF